MQVSKKAVPVMLTPKQVSQKMGVSEAVLANWRSQNTGPGYVKKNGKILYSSESVSVHMNKANYRSMYFTHYKPAVLNWKAPKTQHNDV